MKFYNFLVSYKEKELPFFITFNSIQSITPKKTILFKKHLKNFFSYTRNLLVPSKTTSLITHHLFCHHPNLDSVLFFYVTLTEWHFYSFIAMMTITLSLALKFIPFLVVSLFMRNFFGVILLPNGFNDGKIQIR